MLLGWFSARFGRPVRRTLNRAAQDFFCLGSLNFLRPDFWRKGPPDSPRQTVDNERRIAPKRRRYWIGASPTLRRNSLPKKPASS